MKNFKFMVLSAFLISASLILIPWDCIAGNLPNAAKQPHQNLQAKATTAIVSMETISGTFQEQLKELAGKYLLLKEAFVATDAKAAAKAANKFLEQLDKVDMELLKGDAHMFWMKQLMGMKGDANQIILLKDVEAQRRQFGHLSELLIKTLQTFGIEGEELFVIHCPMALDSKGADWISAEKEVRNPYLGDKMLACGMVTGTFPSPKENPFFTVKQKN